MNNCWTDQHKRWCPVPHLTPPPQSDVYFRFCIIVLNEMFQYLLYDICFTNVCFIHFFE